MAPALHPKDASRLAKVCGLLTSNHDGERANAAALASRMLADCGLTWETLVTRATQASIPPKIEMRSQPRPPYSSGWTHIDLAKKALTRPAFLTPWEVSFLTSIRGQLRSLSPKQRVRLDAIMLKLAQAGAV